MPKSIYIIIYWLILLCSVRVFDLKIVPQYFHINIEIIGVGIMVIIILMNISATTEFLINARKAMPITLLGLSIFSSTIGANIFNDQPIINSIIASRVLFYYLFYIVLHILKLNSEFIIRSIILIALLYFIIYIIQFVIYPSEIVYSNMSPDRAKVRIRLPGRTFTSFACFLSLYYFSSMGFNNKLRYIIIWSISLFSIILSVTRSIIFATLIPHLIYVLNRHYKYILPIGIAVFLVGLLFYFSINQFDPLLLNNVFNTLQEDSSLGDEYIRIRAMHYYMDNVEQNLMGIILGNGNATGGNNFTSLYSKRVNYERDLGFYLDDLGLFGTVYRYGIFYFLFVVGIFYRVFFRYKKVIKKSMSNYLFYFFTYLILISFIIDLFGINTDSVVLICISFYLIDLNLLSLLSIKFKKRDLFTI